MIISLFFRATAFMYLSASNAESMDWGNLTSVFHTNVGPILNPITYSLCSKDVKFAMKKTLRRNVFSWAATICVRNFQDWIVLLILLGFLHGWILVLITWKWNAFSTLIQSLFLPSILSFLFFCILFFFFLLSSSLFLRFLNISSPLSLSFYNCNYIIATLRKTEKLLLLSLCYVE